MATDTASTVLLWMLEAPPEVDAEWNDWYNTEHVPALMQVPGFLNGARYRRAATHRGGAPIGYLAYYELTSREVLESDAYRTNRASLGEGMQRAWTERMLGAVTRAAGGIYEIGRGQAFTAPPTVDRAGGLLLVGGADTEPTRAWIDGVPAMPEVLGFRELRLAAGSPRIAAMRDRDETPALLFVIATADEPSATTVWSRGTGDGIDFAVSYERILNVHGESVAD